MSGERAAETVGEYTPTTDEVRPWIDPMRQRFSDDEIDRWLAATEARGARAALLSAADVIESADVYDELSRPDARGMRWSKDSVIDAVEHSGPIADWLRARAEQTGADR